MVKNIFIFFEYPYITKHYILLRVMEENNQFICRFAGYLLRSYILLCKRQKNILEKKVISFEDKKYACQYKNMIKLYEHTKFKFSNN